MFVKYFVSPFSISGCVCSDMRVTDISVYQRGSLKVEYIKLVVISQSALIDSELSQIKLHLFNIIHVSYMILTKYNAGAIRIHSRKSWGFMIMCDMNKLMGL